MMKIQYLEIVTTDVAAQSALWSKNHGVEFTGPIAELGNAVVATLHDGARVGIREPMHDAEEPVMRPYFLTTDIDAAVKQAEQAGAEIAHPPLEIPGQGTFAIFILNGLQQGLWQI